MTTPTFFPDGMVTAPHCRHDSGMRTGSQWTCPLFGTSHFLFQLFPRTLNSFGSLRLLTCWDLLLQLPPVSTSSTSPRFLYWAVPRCCEFRLASFRARAFRDCSSFGFEVAPLGQRPASHRTRQQSLSGKPKQMSAVRVQLHVVSFASVILFLLCCKLLACCSPCVSCVV